MFRTPGRCSRSFRHPSPTEAAQVITRLKDHPNNQGYHDLLIAEILFREAKAKINGNAESTREDDPKEPDSTEE